MSKMSARKTSKTPDELLPKVQVLTMMLAGIVFTGMILAARLVPADTAAYLWLDVAVVHFLCALPLSGAIAGWLLQRHSHSGILLIAGLVFSLWLLLVFRSGSTGDSDSAAGLAMALIVRAVGSLSVSVAIVLVLATLTSLLTTTSDMVRDNSHSARSGQGFAIFSACLLFMAPAIYTLARTQHDLKQLTILLQQSRLGEARMLAVRVAALNPIGTWQGHPIQSVATDLERKVSSIEERVAAPLSVEATAEERLNRARDLAILGRTESAIAMLESSEVSGSPDTWNLLGTIYETRREWIAGRTAYERADRVWKSQEISPETKANQIRALTGIAYCERKMGRYVEAEKAYLALLALSPSADNHFLLAQFYEDTQRASLAEMHARRAISLDPERYALEGAKLIDKLVTLHFGCWGVGRSEL
jgi:tetratricopeptide (TPR) repeat protein